MTSQIARMVRIQRWVWVSPTPVPADPIADLNTKDNCLSVWIVDPPEILKEIAAGFCVMRSEASKIEFLLFPGAEISQIGISMTDEAGDLPIPGVNGQHRNLNGFTAQQLVNFAAGIYGTGVPKSFTKEDNLAMIKNMIASGILDKAKVKGKLAQQLEK